MAVAIYGGDILDLERPTDSVSALDRTLLDYSSKCAEPLCWAFGLLRFRLVAPLDPAKFDNCQSKVAEVALRIFIGLAGLFLTFTAILPITALILGAVSKILRAIAFALQKDNHTHIPGSAAEKTIVEGQVKVMTWNVCGIGGGMHYDHGGVNHWRDRLDGIVEKIVNQDADVLVLQEIYDTALAEALIERLESKYAHFYAHLGANTLGSVGGVMVLSKCAVHSFKNTSFDNNHWSLNRTFATLEIKAKPSDYRPCARIIGTHFIHDDNAARIVQLQQVAKSLENAPRLPTVLMGDLNFERDVPEEGGVLNQYVEHGHLGNEPTQTDKLVEQWDGKPGKEACFIDYISLFKGPAPQERQARLVNTQVIKAYSDDYDTRTALSDHNPLVSTLLI